MKTTIAILSAAVLVLAALCFMQGRAIQNLDNEMHNHLALQATHNDWRWDVTNARIDSLKNALTPGRK